MKKRFVFLFVIAVYISLFASSTIFAQSPAWAPEPGTMAYLEWFVATQYNPSGWHASPSGYGWYASPSPAWAPEPGTMAYLEWFVATQGRPYFSMFEFTYTGSFGSGLSYRGSGSPSGFGESPSGFGN